MMRHSRGVYAATFLLFSLGGANAASICDPEIIAQLKNVSEENSQKTVEDKIFYSFCQKNKSSGTTLTIGSDSGQLNDSRTASEACLTGNKSYFWNASHNFLVSTLPEAVQRQLIFACSPGGLLFDGFDDGTTITVTAKYQRSSDGSSQVQPLKVERLIVSGDGKEIKCKGSLSKKGTAISLEGTQASCERDGNHSRLKVQLDTLEGKKNISAEIGFEGTKLIEIPWQGPSVPGTDGNWFHCSAWDGSYYPGPNIACRDVGWSCDRHTDRTNYCAAVHGTHFELNPSGDLYRLKIASYKAQADTTKCNDPSTNPEKDICVLRRTPVRTSVDAKINLNESFEE